ncbi:MAG: oligosaccharide flippase family protein [Bdellovibrionales bacterium]|nr:oligosaccharide flippase family protein [Bdellovibrionales bacterium]
MKLRLLNRLNSDFKKNVATLMSGSVVAQLLPFLVSPLLTRIYSPTDFGIFAVYMGLSALFSVFATGRYEFAIFLPKTHESAINILVLSLLVALVFCLLLFPFSLGVRFLTGDHWKIISELGSLIYFVPVGAFVNASFRCFGYWLNRREKYKKLAVSKILRSLGITSASLIMGYLGFLKWGLIFADVFGLGLASIYLATLSVIDSKKLKKYITMLRVRRMAVRYSQFPRVLSFSSVIEMANTHLPSLLLTNFYSAEIAGYFSLTQRVIFSPVSLVSRSVGDVFRQRASQLMAEQGNCRRLFDKTAKSLALIGFVPTIILLLFAPYLFRHFFGAEWEISGHFAQILALTFGLQFVASPISVMFMVAEKQKSDLYMQIYLFLAIIMAFVFSHEYFVEHWTFVYLLAMVYAIYYLFFIVLSRRYSQK